MVVYCEDTRVCVGEREKNAGVTSPCRHSFTWLFLGFWLGCLWVRLLATLSLTQETHKWNTRYIIHTAVQGNRGKLQRCIARKTAHIRLQTWFQIMKTIFKIVCGVSVHSIELGHNELEFSLNNKKWGKEKKTSKTEQSFVFKRIASSPLTPNHVILLSYSPTSFEITTASNPYF